MTGLSASTVSAASALSARCEHTGQRYVRGWRKLLCTGARIEPCGVDFRRGRVFRQRIAQRLAALAERGAHELFDHREIDVRQLVCGKRSEAYDGGIDF